MILTSPDGFFRTPGREQARPGSGFLPRTWRGSQLGFEALPPGASGATSPRAPRVLSALVLSSPLSSQVGQVRGRGDSAIRAGARPVASAPSPPLLSTRHPRPLPVLAAPPVSLGFHVLTIHSAFLVPPSLSCNEKQPCSAAEDRAGADGRCLSLPV